MDEFEKQLDSVRIAVERFVRYRLPSQTDADDVLQEIYLTAYQRFAQLKNKDSFKAWIISIARNKCNDYFRMKAAQMEISIEELTRKEFAVNRRGISVVHTVRETLDLLGDKDKQILYLYFWKEMPQLEIAKLLDIPIGTVKSRLHTAKQHFKDKYPYSAAKPKGETTMRKTRIKPPTRSSWMTICTTLYSMHRTTKRPIRRCMSALSTAHLSGPMRL